MSQSPPKHFSMSDILPTQNRLCFVSWGHSLHPGASLHQHSFAFLSYVGSPASWIPPLPLSWFTLSLTEHTLESLPEKGARDVHFLRAYHSEILSSTLTHDE